MIHVLGSFLCHKQCVDKQLVGKQLKGKRVRD